MCFWTMEDQTYVAQEKAGECKPLSVKPQKPFKATKSGTGDNRKDWRGHSQMEITLASLHSDTKATCKSAQLVILTEPHWQQMIS